MSIYLRYASDGTIVFFLSFFWWLCLLVYEWRTWEIIFNNLGKRSHVNFLGYAHWFMSIRISHMNDNSISMDQATYATSIVVKYLGTAIVKVSTKFIRPHYQLTLYSQKMMHIPVMNKLISWLGNSTLTTDIALVHWFICYLQ